MSSGAEGVVGQLELHVAGQIKAIVSASVIRERTCRQLVQLKILNTVIAPIFNS